MFSQVKIILFWWTILYISVEVQAQDSEAVCTNSLRSALDPQPSWICHNLTSFPTQLENIDEIKTLYLFGLFKNSSTHTLKNGTMSNMTNLEFLYLHKSHVKEIEIGAFRGGSNIKMLSLRGNKIEELDLNVFEDLPNLQTLILSFNPIKNFSNEFPNVNLKRLFLINCTLRSINPSWFKNLENLQELNLEGNLLQTIDWTIIKPLKALQKFSMDGNPINCDCHVKFVLEYLDERQIDWGNTIWTSQSEQGPTCVNSNEEVELFGIDRENLFCLPEVLSIQKFKRQQTTYVQCMYSGYPEPLVAWKVNGELLQINDSNLVQTNFKETDRPEFNYRFKQVLFVHLLPISFHRNESQFTCQVYNSFFNSSESNPISVNLGQTTTTGISTGATSEVPLNTVRENHTILEDFLTTEKASKENLQTELPSTFTSKSKKENQSSAVFVVVSLVGILLVGVIIVLVTTLRYFKRRSKIPTDIYTYIDGDTTESKDSTCAIPFKSEENTKEDLNETAAQLKEQD